MIKFVEWQDVNLEHILTIAHFIVLPLKFYKFIASNRQIANLLICTVVSTWIQQSFKRQNNQVPAYSAVEPGTITRTYHQQGKSVIS